MFQCSTWIQLRITCVIHCHLTSEDLKNNSVYEYEIVSSLEQWKWQHVNFNINVLLLKLCTPEFWWDCRQGYWWPTGTSIQNSVKKKKEREKDHKFEWEGKKMAWEQKQLHYTDNPILKLSIFSHLFLTPVVQLHK